MKAVPLFGRAGPAWALLAVALVTASAACTASGGGEGGDAASSCAALVEYEKHTYTGAEAKGFVLGDELGTVTIPGCDDTPGDDNDGQATPASATAYAIKGVDPGVAIALEDSADDVIFVNAGSGTGLPEIKKLIQGS
ncbi:DUF6281 family protein [Streptomyces sp. NPDC058751]|uniref:DUF6281 family protein n=1 Tax=Streptomyces sp. NPDC058751 TaxID=3346623 RepID=UPI0036BE9DCC